MAMEDDEYPTAVARVAVDCPKCGAEILPMDDIVRVDGEWVCPEHTP